MKLPVKLLECAHCQLNKTVPCQGEPELLLMSFLPVAQLFSRSGVERASCLG